MPLLPFLVSLLSTRISLSTSLQVEDMSPFGQHLRDNSTDLKVGLHDSLWTPVLLYWLTLMHFSLSSILIISYWHLKARCIALTILASL